MRAKIHLGWLATAGCLLAARMIAAEFREDFSANPADNGWRIFGDAALFRWDASNQNLSVAWDSSRSNSYFYRSLGGMPLAKSDDFEIRFDLRLESVRVGVRADKPFTFEIAVGLIQLASATSTNFVRGTGSQSPNLVEFDYFPDSGFGATISPTIVSSNSQFESSFTFPLELATQSWFRVAMRFEATNLTLVTTMERDGKAFGPIKSLTLGPSFTDFRVDAFAISSYADQGSDGSILATGVIDEVRITLPPPPMTELAGSLEADAWRVDFQSRSNWIYTLEHTVNFQEWEALTPAAEGTSGILSLRDPSRPADRSFYRVRAERP